MKENRLWIMPTSVKALELCAKTAHSYGNADHCLFIGPEGPEGSTEVAGELTACLSAADWRWIYGESDKIRAEQEAIYREQIAREQKKFFDRFEAALKEEMAKESET